MPRVRTAALVVGCLVLTPMRVFGYGLAEDFGVDGVASIAPGFVAKGVLVDPDGRIIAVGGRTDASFIARVLADGTLDATFGGTGTVTTTLIREVRAVARQVDGKLVTAGDGVESDGHNFAVARWHDDGTLDPTFGSGGVAIVNAGGTEIAYQIAVQPDGKSWWAAGPTTGSPWRAWKPMARATSPSARRAWSAATRSTAPTRRSGWRSKPTGRSWPGGPPF